MIGWWLVPVFFAGLFAGMFLEMLLEDAATHDA